MRGYALLAKCIDIKPSLLKHCRGFREVEKHFDVCVCVRVCVHEPLQVVLHYSSWGSGCVCLCVCVSVYVCMNTAYGVIIGESCPWPKPLKGCLFHFLDPTYTS